MKWQNSKKMEKLCMKEKKVWEVWRQNAIQRTLLMFGILLRLLILLTNKMLNYMVITKLSKKTFLNQKCFKIFWANTSAYEYENLTLSYLFI